MPNRREFFKAAASLTTGMYVGRGFVDAGVPAFQATPGKRREVVVGGKRVKVIDVHAHCTMPEVAQIVKGTPLASNAGGGGNPLGPDRLRAMDERGIDIQALSINGYWWYAAERELARRIVQVHDQGLAKWVAAHPDRFVALTSIALQHPDLAAEQLEYAVKQLGFRGASIGGHVQGEDVSLPKFDPFWAKAEQLGVIVFMHPGGADNIIKEGGLRGRGDLGNIIGNPLETTYFFSRLIFDGTLDRFPKLRVCGAHAGGYLPSYMGRTDVACDVRGNAKCANKKHPREYFKDQLMIDSMIFSEEGLRHLVAEVGVNQVVYGTDIPFNWPDSVDVILRAPFLNDAQKEAILGGTLAKLMKIAT